MKLFLVALRFLSRLPAPELKDISPSQSAASMAAFPLVGALLGLMFVLLDAGLRMLTPPLPAAALLLAGWALLTGGLHLDGFIDCCDGLWAAKSPAQRLDILRDTHVGAYGVIGGILLLLVKFSALAALDTSLRGPALIIAPIVARWNMVFAAYRYPYARPGPGLGQWFKQNLKLAHVLIALLSAIALCTAAHRWMGPVALVAGGLWALLLAGWARGRLGGLTGDVYGMICETTEIFLLLFFVAGARTGSLL